MSTVDSKKISSLLQSVGAILTDDHFVYTSGKHGSVYINKDALYPHPEVTAQVCQILAKQCQHLDIETVVAPALGGIILSQWLAYFLSQIKGQEIYGVYAEKDPQRIFTFNRGYDRFVHGKRVLAVEDLTNTGGSVKKVVDVIREFGGQVMGVCVMANRSPKLVNSKLFQAEFIAGTVIPAVAYDAKDCPLCAQGKPINTKVGHGRSYVQSQT